MLLNHGIMRKIIILFITIIFITYTTISCSKDPGSGTGGTTLDCSTVSNKAFSADVNPIIQARCNIPGCHASGSSNGPGAFTNYAEVFNARSLVRSVIASGRMPQGGALSTSQKNSILCWIDSGAPNN